MATLERCVKPVFEAMSLEERGLLHLLLVHGKELEAQLKALGADLNDPKVLNGYGERETVAGVVDKLQSAFESGSGLLDALAGRFDNYGAQLDYVFNKVLAKALKVARPLFDEDPESLPGALLREQWITEKLLEALWDRLPEEAKREIAKKTEEL